MLAFNQNHTFVFVPVAVGILTVFLLYLSSRLNLFENPRCLAVGSSCARTDKQTLFVIA